MTCTAVSGSGWPTSRLPSSPVPRGDKEAESDRFCGFGAFAVSEQERVNYPAFMRDAYRSSLRGTYTLHNLGFRCAKDLP